jgi:hypothetical protein
LLARNCDYADAIQDDAIDLQVNSCRTKEVFLEETLLKKGFFQTIFPKLLISYCNLISGSL